MGLVGLRNPQDRIAIAFAGATHRLEPVDHAMRQNNKVTAHLLKGIERWTIERVVVATGLYLTPDGKIMVAYGARQIPLSCAEYKANGYRPFFEKLQVKLQKATVPSVSVLPGPATGRPVGRRV